MVQILLFADDTVLVADKESDLNTTSQYSKNQLENTSWELMGKDKHHGHEQGGYGV